MAPRHLVCLGLSALHSTVASFPHAANHIQVVAKDLAQLNPDHHHYELESQDKPKHCIDEFMVQNKEMVAFTVFSFIVIVFILVIQFDRVRRATKKIVMVVKKPAPMKVSFLVDPCYLQPVTSSAAKATPLVAKGPLVPLASEDEFETDVDNVSVTFEEDLHLIV